MTKGRLVASALVSLALPASASAATGTVLSVDRQHHTIQVADSHHVVAAYQYRGNLPKIHLGSLISFTKVGHSIVHVRANGGTHRVSFTAQVVRASKHRVVLRLADGKSVRFSAKQLRRGHRGHRRHAVLRNAPRASASGTPSVTVNINGLQPGENVLVTESVDSHGNITITITLPPAGGGGEGGTDQDVVGTITAISASGLTINTPDHGAMNFAADDPDVTDGYAVGDSVDVTYEQLSDGSLDATDVEYDEQDVTGTVSAVSAGSLSLVQDGSSQAIAFVADPADGVFDGILPGQHVDVTYHQSAAGLVADSVDDGSGN